MHVSVFNGDFCSGEFLSRFALFKDDFEQVYLLRIFPSKSVSSKIARVNEPVVRLNVPYRANSGWLDVESTLKRIFKKIQIGTTLLCRC